jgi:hypothetical protein
MLCLAQWPWINVVNHEVGDFAANSLLIENAKAFHLMLGAFSRVGFYHPGPALLYVLALGEWLFFDVLGVVKSPFSGQLIAIAFYTAFWIVALFRILARMSESSYAAGVAVSAFLLATSVAEHSFFMGPWLPNLYYFPFAVALMAGTRLATGRVDSIRLLAISSGFVINGHVSFISTLAIIFIGILIFNGWAYWKGDGEHCIFRRPFWKLHGREVVFATLILLLFFVPLLIDTVIHFPGQVAKYLSFGSGRVPNDFAAIVRYIGVYWGGPSALTIPILAFVLLLFLSTRPQPNRDWQAMLAILLTATLAMAFYVRYGVDMLNEVYIGYFYYAVPALLAALLALVVVKLNQPANRALCLIVIVGGLAGVFVLNKQPTNYSYQYNQPAVVEMYDALKAVRKEGRIVLDVPPSAAWGAMWVGTQLYADRQHEDFFCVNRNWHVSFSEHGRCTPQEAISNQRFIVREPPARLDGMTPAFENTGFHFYAFNPPNAATLGRATVAEQTALFQDYFLVSGWSGETPYVWSVGKEAQIILNFPRNFVGTVTFDFGAYIPRAGSTLDVAIEVSNKTVATAIFSNEKVRQRVDVHVDNRDKERVLFTVKIRNPSSPKDNGSSPDTRLLGVSLFGFQVTPD